MLTPSQQLERLTHMRLAIQDAEPALTASHEAGPDIRIDVDPSFTHADITFAISECELADAAALADALGFTENSHTPYKETVHYNWRGALGGFNARVLFIDLNPGADQ